MKKLSFGEIVLLEFPFADGENSKRRPAMVLADTSDGDIIVCRITSKLYNSVFDYEVKEWVICGLKIPSVIRLHKIATLEKGIIDKSIGMVDKELKNILLKDFNTLIS